MAAVRIVGKNARMYVNDIALYLRMFEMENTMELNTEEATAYGVDWQEFAFIDGAVTMGVNAFMDETRPVLDTEDLVTDAAYVNTFQDDGGSVFKTDPVIPIIFIPGNTAAGGDKAFFMDSILGSVVLSAPRSGVQRLRGRFVGAQSLRAGFIIAQIEQAFPSGDTFIPAPTTGIDIGVEATILTSSVANPTVITTAAAHGLSTGDSIHIANHTGSTPDINGTHTVTVLTNTTFTIPVNVTVDGTGGTLTTNVGTAVAYCVYKKTGSSAFIIDIEDADLTGGSYASANLFPSFTGTSSQYREDKTDEGKQFHRVRINNAGASETLGLIIVSTNIQ